MRVARTCSVRGFHVFVALGRVHRNITTVQAPRAAIECAALGTGPGARRSSVDNRRARRLLPPPISFVGAPIIDGQDSARRSLTALPSA
nr:unnamed protein product [Digitaria exilis]